MGLFGSQVAGGPRQRRLRSEIAARVGQASARAPNPGQPVPSREWLEIGGVVSGLLNPTDSSVGALERRPRHDEGYHEGGGCRRRHFAFDVWSDAIEDGVRARVRSFIETMLEEELEAALARPRCGRRKANGNEEAAPPLGGHRHGRRERALTGTFGTTKISVPRARLMGEDGKTREWKSASLRAYQRRTKAADALIAGAYLSGTNTRRVRRALASVFKGKMGKDVVSRAWRRVKGDWMSGTSARPPRSRSSGSFSTDGRARAAR